MARIPDELLRRIREEVPLERLAEARGVELKRHGADLIGRCPFHDDREPSLVVTPAKNLWHCLGACQTGGSPIDWVMKAEGVSFRHAVEILRADHFPTMASLDTPQRSTVPKLAPPVDLDADDRELLGQVIGYYHQTLKESPDALAYLENRGLVHPELVDRFQLGYANRTLGYRLPAMNRRAGQEIRTRLQKLGVLRDSGHEHLNGSLVVPILGEGGEVLGAYGRKITPAHQLRAGTPLHLYLPGPHRGVFNVGALVSSKEVILCEALLDALTFWCAGFRNVTAAYGVEGFTHDHLAAFKAYGTEHVLIAYDRDEAGDKAAESLAKKLTAEGIGCSRVQFPKGMDANEYALKVQPAGKALGLLLRTAAWMGNGAKTASTASAAAAAPAEAATPPPAAPVSASPLAPIPPVPAVRTSEQPAPLAAKEKKLQGDASQTTPDLDEAVVPLGDRRYRLRGLKKNLAWGVLKLNVLVTREGAEAEALFAPPSPLSGFFVDTLDLYSARQRAAFEKQASHELGMIEETIKRDLGQLLRKAEDFQQESIRKTLEPKEKAVLLSEEETAEALAFLRDPNLLGRILEDFETGGLVGEDTNKLTAYLAAVSRKLDKPLAVIVQSSSAAGKSALMEAVLGFVPEEEREKYSALTGQSLFYFGEGKSLRHKILAIAEEEGAEKAGYALKLLQSEGELSIASTGKDPQTGRLVTQEYRVEGPVMIFLTTTAIEIDEELLNRCLVLTVDESREQTRRIHELQRRASTLDGILALRRKPKALKVHRNAQRLLRPLLVHNPYASRLTFLDEKTRMRRDHVKYLKLIEAIALLFQYQREVKTLTVDGEIVEYVEATLADVGLANRLASEVLGRSLDELPPQTRRLLVHLDDLVTSLCEKHGVAREDLRFSRRDVRAATGWGDTQLKVHMARLVELEYLLLHRGGRGQSFVYELLYRGEGKDGSRFLPGLLDITGLAEYDGERSGLSAERSAPGRPLVGGWSGAGRGEEDESDLAPHAHLNGFSHEEAETPLLGATLGIPSYPLPEPKLVLRRAAGRL
ncbi:MAG: toprim domain-containing protein [Holophagales bacterium]|nr:toprim domain-containing protein [Holophagales bacterium]MBK9967781.1 toprim domain-containing protein [Holophagales bacterium]